MSAWICSHRHINLIASYAAAHRISFIWNGERIDCEREQQRVATVLLNENYRSVNYRYDENNSDTITFEHVIVSDKSEAYILKQLGCYDYQACEGPHYDDTLAKAIIQRCEDTVLRLSDVTTFDQIRHTPEYDAAPWGVD